jgi:hypothetical protein
MIQPKARYSMPTRMITRANPMSVVYDSGMGEVLVSCVGSNSGCVISDSTREVVTVQVATTVLLVSDIIETVLPPRAHLLISYVSRVSNELSVMSEKTLKEAVDDWEREANKLIEETRKVESLASKELKKQIKVAQVEGAKLIDSIKDGLGDADFGLRKELENRLNTIQDKLTRAWEELNN